MFQMKYFRSYPWMLQLFLLLMLVVTMMSGSAFICMKLLPVFTPYVFTQLMTVNEHSPASLIQAAIVVQGVMSLFIFLVPSFLYAYLSHPRPAEYLGLRKP